MLFQQERNQQLTFASRVLTCLSFSSTLRRYKRRGQTGELVTSLGELGGRLGGNLLPGFLVFSMFSQQCDEFKQLKLTLRVSCLSYNRNRLIQGLSLG